MPIPTEPVGSLPRPTELQAAYRDFDANLISHEEFVAAQDKAVVDSLNLMTSTGQDFITDGEMRHSSFATYPLTDTLGGKGFHPLLAPDGIVFAVFEDGHTRQLPRINGGPFNYTKYAYQLHGSPAATDATSSTKLKMSVISPTFLYLLYPLDGEIEGYSRRQFCDDLVSECVKDIRECFAHGASRVSIDCTELRLSLKHDSTLWMCKGLFPIFIELLNRVIDQFTPAERQDIGIHSCAGGDHCSSHSASVPYEQLLPGLLSLNAGYFLLSFSSESESRKTAILACIADHLRPAANGVIQQIFLGVTNPSDPRIETAEEIRDVLVEAVKALGQERIGATDDCGFSPFSDDAKEKLGGVDSAREIARAKLTARVVGARLASEVLNM